MKVLAFLMKYSKRMVVLAALAGILSGAANTGLLALINAALTRDDISKLSLLWIFIALCFVVPLTRIMSELMLTRLGQETVYDLRMQMSRKILSVPLAHLEKLGSSRLMATLTDDIPAITNVVTLLPVFSINFAVLAGCLAYMGWLSWKVLIGVLIFIIIGVVSYQLPIARAMKHFRVAWKARDRLYEHFRALIDGSKELKLHHQRRNSFLTRVLHNTASEHRDSTITAQKIYTIASSWGQLLVFVVIGVVVFGAPAFAAAPADRETLTGFSLALLYLMTPLQTLMNSFPGFSRAEIALSRVQDMGVDLDSHAQMEEFTESLDPSWETIRFSGVSYTYLPQGEETPFELGPIDLELQQGEMVFIAGGNGSGKTTFSKVLVGLYAPDEGTIEVDGMPITEENREDYRQLFTVLFSDFFLFDTFLGLESPEVDQQARRYLAELQLDKKVEIEDAKLSTTKLSAGQKKRLALLTAYLEDRPIYVFDEWAADQDPYFRDVFYRKILPELKARNKTVIVISHDDRYYQTGDRLLKLDMGRIVLDQRGSDSIAALTGMEAMPTSAV